MPYELLAICQKCGKPLTSGALAGPDNLPGSVPTLVATLRFHEQLHAMEKPPAAAARPTTTATPVSPASAPQRQSLPAQSPPAAPAQPTGPPAEPASQPESKPEGQEETSE